MTKQESIETYTQYIEAHIENVNQAFKRYGEKLCESLNIDYDRLKWMIQEHDKSKFEKEEFEGYRRNFYKSDDEEDDPEAIKEEFDNAWIHHLSVNAHHPEFWVNTNDNSIYIMDKYHIAEMLLDWCAMGIAQGEEHPAYDYWVNGEGTKKPIRKEVAEIIDSCIDIFSE